MLTKAFPVTTLDRLVIDGIRSYYPGNRQVIKFYKPLTLILGANGCGKTTIIEALRMSTTGKLPPNSGHGSSFVHDAKISDRTEVKAQIVLRFETVAHKLITVKRNFSTNQRKATGNPEYKQLETNLTIKDVLSGEKQETMSKRCAEMDKAVPIFMGVSQAILEHVIFCHQEESNWVLGEPKILKERFDAIFASTRYSQALDTIKKLQKQQSDDIKDLDKEQGELKIYKERAQELRRNKQGLEEQKSALQGEVKEMQAKAKRDKELIAKCQTALNGSADLTNEKHQYQVEIKSFANRLEQLKKCLPDDAQYSEDHLPGIDASLIELENRMTNSKQFFETLDIKIADLRQSLSSKTGNIQRLQSLESDLKAEKEAFKTNIFKWKSLCLEISDRLHLGFSEDSLTMKDEYPSKFCKTVTDVVKVKEKEQAEVRKKHTTEQDKIKAESSDLENMCKSNNETISKNRAELIKAKNSLAEGKREIKTLEDQVASIGKARERLRGLEQDVEVKKTGFDESGKKRAIDDLLTQEQNLKQERKWLSEKQQEISKQYEKKIIYDTNVSALAELEDEIRNSIADIRSALMREKKCALSHIPDEPIMLETMVVEYEKKVAETLEEVKQKYRDVQEERGRIQSKKEHIRGLVDGQKKDMDMLKLETENLRADGLRIAEWEEEKVKDQTLLSACKEAISRLQRKKDDLDKELHGLTLQEGLSQMYAEHAEKTRCCLICDRAFESSQKVAEFLEKMQKSSEKMGSEDKKEKEKELRKLCDAIGVMQGAQSKLEKVASMKEQEAKHNEDISMLDDELEKVELPSMCPTDEAEENVSKAKALVTLVGKLRTEELSRLRDTIDATRAEFGDAVLDGGATKEDNESRLKHLDDELERIYEEKERTFDALNSHRSDLQKLQDDLFKSRERVGLLGLDEDKLVAKKASYAEIEARVTFLTQELETLSNSKAPNEDKLRKNRDVLKKMQEEHDREETKIADEVNILRKDLVTIENQEGHIWPYISGGRDKDLERKTRDKLEAEAEHACLVKDLDQAASEKKMSLDSSNQMETDKRRLSDAKELIELQKSIKDRKDKVKVLESKLKNMPDDAETSTFLQDRIDARENLVAQINQKNGQMEVLDQEIQKNVAELEQKKFEKVDERYKFATTKWIAKKLSNEDLQKYYQALDRALMKFHEMKMDEINKIIKEYWQSTYKGSDIETIEIKADVETAANRRSHNYRLVMKYKTEAQLDMRGRCSAGQKVLASLVVRLALAETFCHNCGILALDEPTSNLDHHNIDGFTDALAKIVMERAKSGFQLIVISHDDDFIEKLARTTRAEEYYRVTKNDDDSFPVARSVITSYEVRKLD